MAADSPPARRQLTTRVPESLRRRLRIQCVVKDVSVQEFVVAALREQLAREAARDTRA